MERPVELHAAGRPRAERPDQAGLDHMLAVKKVVAGRLVARRKDLAADFGQNDHLQPVVLQPHRRVGLLLTVRPIDGQRRLVGIGSSRRALMIATFGKEGHFLLRRIGIGGQNESFHRDSCSLHGCFLLKKAAS